jgi:aspartyl-tRNA(Asn)/glutamyl-tRNA(Gln) amidotransferase subunit B
MSKNYEMVIGLEVHVELGTKTKLFCGCPTQVGAEPNTQCCPVCTGMPGTLPVPNRRAVDFAVKAGLATNCTIARYSKQDRKNYFYPDLPKAYQISQYDLPLCEHGYLDVESESGPKRIGITRIHIEEDAGKLLHDPQKGTLLDNNRCGVPLIEIVSEPDIRSAEEADAYLRKLRAILIYTGVSECKMNEGAMRCDVNLSVREKGETKFGTRTETKNINSFSFVTKAIEYEFKRQIEAVEAGEPIIQETRRFDVNTGKTYSMRKKENANDYRYFPDPDLMPIELPEKTVAALKAEIPMLPDERKAIYMRAYKVSAYDGEMLTNSREVADFFEQAAKLTDYPKTLANLLITEAFALMTPDCAEVKLAPAHFAAIAQMAGEGRINASTAKRLVRELWGSDLDPEKVVAEKGLEQIRDENVLRKVAADVIAQNEKAVRAYQGGKQTALQSLVGMAMGKTGGKGDAVKIGELLVEMLDAAKTGGN